MMMEKILKFIKNRYFLLGLIITILFTTLGFRLAYLTVEMGAVYNNMAQERKKIEVTLQGPRGSIRDRNGIPLATNKQIYVAQIDRQWMPKQGKQVNELLFNVIEVINKYGDSIKDNLPIKYGVKVYEDLVPYTVKGYYYDFGTEDPARYQELYNAWRKDAGIKEDLPADEMFALLRKRYEIEQNISDEIARMIVSIRLDLYLNRFKQDEPVKIAEDINSKTVSHLETYSDELPGIQTVIESGRYYPYGTSAQHIIGYVGRITDKNIESYTNKYGESPTDAGYNIFNDKYGQDGIEAYAEQWLTSSTLDKHGYLEAEVDASRRVIQVLEEKVPQSGNDVILTIDSRLQRLAENILKEETKKMREGLPPYEGDSKAPLAHSGSIVILDVKTGEILAMASYADSEYTYDLNDFAKGISTTDFKNLVNDSSNPLFANAFQGGLEPGSVFKMMVGTAALMEGKVTITETIYDNHQLRPSAPACWSAWSHGSLNIMDALKVSCNYYFTEIGDRLGIDLMRKWAVNFGLQGPTGLELLSLDGKVDMNVVAHPDLMEEQNKKLAGSQIKAILNSKYGVKLTTSEIDAIVAMQHGEISNYLKGTSYFEDTATADNAASDILAIFNSLPRWSDFELDRTPIGQSITQVSPLAVARYVAALANGGMVLETHVLKEVKTPEGELLKETLPKFNQLDIKDEYTAAIKEGMHRVIYATSGPGGNGTSMRAFQGLDPSITLGGKTGTAEVIPDVIERNTAWFTAFTPYENPEVAIVVTLPNGKASGNAAPVGRRMIEEYYRLMNGEQKNTLPVYNELTN